MTRPFPLRSVFAMAIAMSSPALADTAQPDAVVAADGSGQYTSVRAALDAAPQITHDDGRRWTILVKPGEYRELVSVQREKRFIRLVGEDAKTTVIAYDLYAGLPGPDGKPIGTFRTPTFALDGDDFVLENLTIANTAGRKGQALALAITGDRDVVRNCRLTGWQDTLFVNRGRQYFEGCYIEGATDFIFGGASCWFENCDIHAVGAGFLTAASTPDNQAHGFVFSHCRITGEPDVQTLLGRPWRDYAETVFLHTEMSEAIKPVGWSNWGKAYAEKVARYAEYQSSGPGANAAERAAWTKQLSDAEAAAYTVEKVLSGADNWRPTTTQPTTQP